MIMKKSCFCLVLLLTAFVVFSATKVEIKSDKSTVAEVEKIRAKQLFAVSLTFVPVTTLDVVANDEMTEVLAQFFAEEALSSYLKSPKAVDFSKTECIVRKKSEKQCSLTYEIPLSAVTDVPQRQHTIVLGASSVSAETLVQDFRSTCFRDLRVAEAVFLERIKSCKGKDQLAQKINDAFAALEKRINDDDALFISEKEELLAKANKVKAFLLKKLSPNDAALQTDAPQDSAANISHAVFLPEFKPFLLNDPILLDAGGCKAFRTEDGKIVLIAVGNAEVKDQSAKDRIRRRKIAEQRAFGELAKHREVEVTFFSERHKTTTISSSNGVEKGSLQKITSSRITIRAQAYFEEMITVGTWYSLDGKIFYLAKGMKTEAGKQND